MAMVVRCPECQTENNEGSRFCRNCATPLPASSPKEGQDRTATLNYSRVQDELVPGMTFAGRYLVIEEIGRGGMGKVYKVLDQEINEKVSLKLIRPEIAAERETIERFQNEIKIARRITHKNVCRVYHFSRHNQTYYITMEYVSGENLKKMIRMSREMSLEAALSIAQQVCEGLAEAHRLGIVHRDLKPQNVMIDEEGTARIMDFGIASSLETQGATLPGVMIGTPEYISPEQVQGGSVDARSDIYSLGVILYEMLTGSTPFSGDTPWSIAFKHKSETPPDPREINPQIPESLSRVILKCLEKNKEKRYQNAEALQADLKKVEEEHYQTETLMKAGKTPAYGKPFFSLKGKKVAAWGLVILVALSFVAIGLTLGKRFFRGAGAVLPGQLIKMAVITFENQTGERAYDYLQEAIPNLLITSLEQSRFIRITSWERLRDLVKQRGGPDEATIDRDLGFELCRLDGVQAIILGSFVKAGETFATDVKVLDVRTKSILKTVSSRGEGVDSILKKQIDDLSRDIAKGFMRPEEVTQISSTPIAEVTTQSLDAYNYFLRGREDFEKFYYVEAARSLEKAVELDPEFAMAYYYLVRTYGLVVNAEATRQNIAKLQQYGGKVSGKEGLYIQALLADAVDRDGKKYLSLLQKIVADYPEEKRARMDLGIYFYRMAKYREAEAELRRALKLDPKYGYAINMLAYSYIQLKEYKKAIRWFKEYAAVSPGDANPHDSLGDLYFNIGKFDEALEKFEEAVRVKPDFGSTYKISYIHALRGDYAEAMRWIDQNIAAASSNGLKSWGYQLKAVYFYTLGKVSLALAALDEAEQYAARDNGFEMVDNVYRTRIWVCYDWGRFDQFLKYAKERFEYRAAHKIRSESMNIFILTYYQSLFDLREKGLDAAQTGLAEIEKIVSKTTLPQELNSMSTGLEHLRAEILLARGRADDADAAFRRIKRTSIVIVEPYILIQRNVPYLHDILGRAFIMKEKTETAVAHYEKLISPDPRARQLEILHPFNRLELARLYEKEGKREKALAQYEKLGEIWKDADQGLSRVEEARTRLAALRARS